MPTNNKMGKKWKIAVYKPTIKQTLNWHFKHFKIYCYTSVIGAVLMFSLLYISTSVLKIHYMLSFTIVYAIVATTSFILSKFLVFRFFSPKRFHKQYCQFFAISLVFYILNLISLFIIVNFFGVWYLLAQFIISVIGLPVVYLIHRKIVFEHD